MFCLCHLHGWQERNISAQSGLSCAWLHQKRQLSPRFFILIVLCFHSKWHPRMGKRGMVWVTRKKCPQVVSELPGRNVLRWLGIVYFDASNLWSNILCPKAYCLPCYYVWLMPVATVISGLFFDLTALGTVGGDVSWHNQYEEQHGGSSKLKRELPYDQLPLIWYISFWVYMQRKWIQDLKNTSAVPLIHYSQGMQTTYVSINGWMNKDLVYTHNGILFSHEKEGNQSIYLQEHRWALRAPC